MAIELVSVHIPKAGGQSLARTLKQTYGRRLHLRYPPPEQPLSRNLRARLRQKVWQWATFPGPRAVHGHFPASEYGHLPAVFITFIRDPVAQRISTYHYHRRQFEERGQIANLEARKALELSIEDYLTFSAPIYSTYLDIPMERFAFIGSQENFDEDVQVLARLLGLKHSPVRVNTNPQGSDYSIDAAQRGKYEAANRGEIELYRKALERRDQILSRLK
jgi:hypothetical protein